MPKAIRDNHSMRFVLAGLLAAALASNASASRSLVFTVKSKQGPTVAHARPPAGGVGDWYDSSLSLANAGIPQLGRPAHAAVGTMQFTYTIRKQCTSFSPRCRATADFTTVTTLPGGTVKAAGRSISIANPEIVIPVTGGTGRYKGAHGTVSISPTSEKLSTYRLRLP
jgi:hypothetical protein